MQSLHNHIILMGFKHVGKSVIGKNLSEKLKVPFIDLDHTIEMLYENTYSKKNTCRQIMQKHGEKFFRYLEMNALSETLDVKPSIISLGGGTPLIVENQKMIQPCILVHVTAPRGIVFERILMSGMPAFFNPGEDMLKSFNRLWEEREKNYKEITDILIENRGSVDDAVRKITKKLNLDEKINNE